MRFSPLVPFAVLPLVLTSVSTAFAGDAATAQALFDNGKRLMAQRQYEPACSAFEESERLDPGLGTLFHLADCKEHLGKTATAWAGFVAVRAEARAKGEATREAAANNRAEALKPKLARIVVEPGAEIATPGLAISRDGEAVAIGAGEWAVEIPVDAGSHVVEARAPGKGTWRATVSVVDGARTVVTVPLLADVPVESQVSITRTTSGEESTVPRSHGSGQRVAGAVLSVAGLAGLGVGTYFGALSLSRNDDSSAHCRGNVCDATGASQRDDARRDGTVATVALAAGGAVLIAGILTYVTAPHHHDPARAATASSRRPSFGVGPGGLSVSGTW